jgi:exodeoxyribonuclease V alpha subunit
MGHEQVRTGRIALAAPTARAAQRMTAVTGHDAVTLHRLLAWSPTERGFTKNRTDPIDADWLIVDEVSMLDLPLAAALWRATNPRMRVVWIGDEQQLPSVGPGSVLKDVLESAVGPVFRLTHNFRSNSGITVAAHSLLARRVPTANADVAIRPYEKGIDKQRVQDDLVRQLIQLHQHGRPWEAIQVLTPIRRGLLGTDALNDRLRDVMNPAPAHQPAWTAAGGQTFRLGDRVMQIKNAYALNVFNGDLGHVVGIHPRPGDEDDGDRLWVQFLDQVVGFTAEEARHLRLAYATTVHKAQGSEFPIVLCPLFYDSYRMLYRNLVYTAMTRARERLWLFTEASSLWLALKHGDSATRQTGLKEALKS